MTDTRPTPATAAYRELFERSADAILIIEGARFIDCNDATVEMLRYESREALLETHPSELSPPTQPDGRDSFEKANEMMATAFERGSHRFEWSHKRADGEVFPVEVLLTAVQESDRRVLHVVWRDITQRKVLEDQLRHSHKMEAVGKLAGGIAHDFNNMLVAIIGHAELLRRHIGEDPKAREHVQQIRLAGDRAAGLVRQLLAFGRKQQLQPAVFDLDELILGVQKLLERLIGEDITLATRRSSESIHIKADPGQVEQVLMNLASNARDAMPRGGTLTIETRIIDLTESHMGTAHSLPPGRYALLCVGDTGEGMSEETRAHAFDPFFTTKEVGAGTGLGLATVHGIVRQSGGNTELVSTPSVGTTVRVYLPISAEQVEAKHQRIERVEDIIGGTETILVAEDEPLVRAMIVATLEDKGYRVLCASDGIEALRLFRGQPDGIDLILTDVIMPNMGGPEFVAELATADAVPRVLFMSGYTNDTLARFAALDQELDLIEKPFTPAALATRVRRSLEQARTDRLFAPAPGKP